MEMKHCKFAICAIASPLEADYLDEWTKWHKSIGVQAFYIATNGWTWDNKQEDVYTTRVDGRNKQCPYYTNFAHTMASYVDWAAFIDIDEFIRLGDKHKTVLDLAEEFKLCDSVALSWRLFGSNGLHFNGNYSVLKRFTRRQTGFNKHIKSIVNLGKLKTFGDHRRLVFGTPHFPQLQARYTLQQWTVDGRQVSGPYDQNAALLKDNDTWLAHFFCKTPEEWKLKQAQGRVDVPEGSQILFRKDEEFTKHDLNDVEDTCFRDSFCKEDK